MADYILLEDGGRIVLEDASGCILNETQAVVDATRHGGSGARQQKQPRYATERVWTSKWTPLELSGTATIRITAFGSYRITGISTFQLQLDEEDELFLAGLL